MKLNLNKYKRSRPEKLDLFTTGVALERKHKAFIDAHNINLSSLVRDILDKLIKETKESDG